MVAGALNKIRVLAVGPPTRVFIHVHHGDVSIIGAGISSLSAAVLLLARCIIRYYWRTRFRKSVRIVTSSV